MMTIPKAILTRINEINDLMPLVSDSPVIPSTFDGSTYEMYVILERKIVVKNQFIYLVGPDNFGSQFVEGIERYNMNRRGDFDQNGLVDLRHKLSIILKAYKKAIAQGIEYDYNK